MRRRLAGRVVLVAGASRGIGRRIAGVLAARGASVALTARSGDELEAAAGAIRGAGGVAEDFPADLTKPEDREKLVAAVAAKFGRLDGLVNSAGVASHGDFATSSEAILRAVLEVNFFAPAELIRTCLPHLRASAAAGPAGWRPVVLNVASVAGRWGVPSLAEHVASKHALVGLSEAVRVEFERFGIDVLLGMPGVVKTDDPGRHLLRNEPRIAVSHDRGLDPGWVAERLVRLMESNKPEKAVGLLARWVLFGRRVWPRGVRFFMGRKVKKFEARAARGTTQGAG